MYLVLIPVNPWFLLHIYLSTDVPNTENTHPCQGGLW